MPLTLTKVEEFEKIPGSTMWRKKSESPYVRLCAKEGPPIFIQKGRFWSEGGQEVTDLPDWFQTELEKLSPMARERVGLPPPSEMHAPGGDEATAPKMWKCDECGDEMAMNKKGFHIAKHRREQKQEVG